MSDYAKVQAIFAICCSTKTPSKEQLERIKKLLTTPAPTAVAAAWEQHWADRAAAELAKPLSPLASGTYDD